MFSKSSDLVQKSHQNKQEEKFYSRILSKEASMSTSPSFRFYNYEGEPGAVPFLWESRPGTPKCSFNETTLPPPLTPPPSYYYFDSNKNPMIKRTSRSSKLLHVLFPKMIKKNNSSVSSSSLSSSSSLPNLSTVVPLASPKKYQHRFRCRRGSSFDSRVDYSEEDQAENGSSPTSTWCFWGIGKGSSTSGGLLRGR